ncbi:MAG: glycosyltransferase family 39 protein, partial [Chloroflexota bacterium]
MVSYRSPFFITILLLYLVAGTLYATLTPNWQAPDEPAHYNYIRYLATQQRFPELVDACYDQAYLTELTTRRFSPELPVDNVCYEFHQPPLYYLLQTPIYWLSQGSLLALRLTSVLLGAGVVILAFLISKTIKPDHPAIVYGTMAFVAFVPMHLTMLSSVNNDALAEFILAILLLLLIRRLNAGQSKKLNQ